MEGLQVDKVETPNGSRVLTLHGALTLKTLFEFQELLRQDHPSHLIIDLSDVSYMDSAGLGAVLGGYASCERTGRGFGLTGVSERVNTLFQVAGVDKMVPRFESVEAAEKKFAAKAVKS